MNYITTCVMSLPVTLLRTEEFAKLHVALLYYSIYKNVVKN